MLIPCVCVYRVGWSVYDPRLSRSRPIRIPNRAGGVTWKRGEEKTKFSSSGLLFFFYSPLSLFFLLFFSHFPFFSLFLLFFSRTFCFVSFPFIISLDLFLCSLVCDCDTPGSCDYRQLSSLLRNRLCLEGPGQFLSVFLLLFPFFSP